MGSRLELHAELKKISGVKKVYFQAPSDDKLQYPCIVYALDDVDLKQADDLNYLTTKKYSLQVIDSNPDTTIYMDILKKFPMCDFDRYYCVDNLNHYVLSLFY